MVRLGVLLLSLTIGTGALAADIPSDPLFSARFLRCEFGRGHSASWTRDTQGLVIKEGSFSNPPTIIVLDSIDLTERTARFVGNIGASNLNAWASENGLWFLERTLAGNFNLITVFATNTIAPEYPAVMSRHVTAIGDEPIASQYYGTCRVLLG
jgi:hypothetical protein